MNHEDVIKRLQRICKIYQNTIGDYTAVEAINIAISAVEKQEAKQAKMSWDINFGKVRPHCPVCGESNPIMAKYCFTCGQRIKVEEGL